MTSNNFKTSSNKIISVTKISNLNSKPQIPKKRFRYVNGKVCGLSLDSDSQNSSELQSENSDVDHVEVKEHSKNRDVDHVAVKERSVNNDVEHVEVKERSESESNSESEVLSKPECILRECVTYIKQVDSSLTSLLRFKEELDKEFTVDNETTKILNSLFRDVKIIKSAYQIILDTVEKLQSKESGFYLYELLIDPIVSNLLNTYKPFLSQYAINAKWMGDLNRENNGCDKACKRARQIHGIAENVNIDNCLYTVFNSLFSLELMFNRYRNCFEESSEHYKQADEAKNLISNLLSVINTNQDQENFLLTQKELNLLTGRSRDSKVNTRFVYKGTATKFARRDDKSLSRQLVLFSDCLYVTLLPGNIIGTSSVRQELSISSLKVSVINEEDLPNNSNLKWGLSIDAREAVQDFYFDSEQIMKTWRDKLLHLIKEENNANVTEHVNVKNSLIALGAEAPRWQKDSAAGYCNGHRCNTKFSGAIRRHHCRADGLLYCDKCCDFKVKLEFERSAESRVCELCFRILHLHLNNPKSLEDAKEQLEMVMSKRTHAGKRTGWLFVKTFNKDKEAFMPEVKYYCELDLKDPFFKFFEKHEDKCHSEGIILLGMEIRTMKEGSHYYRNLSPKQFIIQHTDKREAYLMKAPSQEECKNWVECLKERISSSFND